MKADCKVLVPKYSHVLHIQMNEVKYLLENTFSLSCQLLPTQFTLSSIGTYEDLRVALCYSC